MSAEELRVRHILTVADGFHHAHRQWPNLFAVVWQIPHDADFPYPINDSRDFLDLIPPCKVPTPGVADLNEYVNSGEGRGVTLLALPSPRNDEQYNAAASHLRSLAVEAADFLPPDGDRLEGEEHRLLRAVASGPHFDRWFHHPEHRCWLLHKGETVTMNSGVHPTPPRPVRRELHEYRPGWWCVHIPAVFLEAARWVRGLGDTLPDRTVGSGKQDRPAKKTPTTKLREKVRELASEGCCSVNQLLERRNSDPELKRLITEELEHKKYKKGSDCVLRTPKDAIEAAITAIGRP